MIFQFDLKCGYKTTETTGRCPLVIGLILSISVPFRSKDTYRFTNACHFSLRELSDSIFRYLNTRFLPSTSIITTICTICLYIRNQNDELNHHISYVDKSCKSSLHLQFTDFSLLVVKCRLYHLCSQPIELNLIYIKLHLYLQWTIV